MQILYSILYVEEIILSYYVIMKFIWQVKLIGEEFYNCLFLIIGACETLVKICIFDKQESI